MLWLQDEKMKDIDLINMMSDYQLSSDTGWMIDNEFGVINRIIETSRDLTSQELIDLSEWFKRGLCKNGEIKYKSLGYKILRWHVAPKYEFSFIEAAQ